MRLISYTTMFQHRDTYVNKHKEANPALTKTHLKIKFSVMRCAASITDQTEKWPCCVEVKSEQNCSGVKAFGEQNGTKRN